MKISARLLLLFIISVHPFWLLSMNSDFLNTKLEEDGWRQLIENNEKTLNKDGANKWTTTNREWLKGISEGFECMIWNSTALDENGYGYFLADASEYMQAADELYNPLNENQKEDNIRAFGLATTYNTLSRLYVGITENENFFGSLVFNKLLHDRYSPQVTRNKVNLMMIRDGWGIKDVKLVALANKYADPAQRPPHTIVMVNYVPMKFWQECT